MNDMILLDGVRYIRYEPKSESEFERMVVENAAQIFGKDAIYLDIKKLIKTEWGKGTIPDGYLFYPEEKRFVLVEVELSSHDVHSHVSRQLATFIGSFENHRSRNKLAKLVQRHIEEDPQLRERLDKAAKGKGLFDFLYNEVFETLAEGGGFETIVVIERETPQILGAMKLLMPHPRVLEVAIYARDGAESVKAMRFVPMAESISVKNEQKKQRIEKKIEGKALRESDYHLPLLKVIIDEGGRISAGDAKKRVYEILKGKLSNVDHEKTPSGRIRWKNWIQWSSLSLRKKGFLSDPSERGIWEITSAGRKYYEQHKDEI